MITPSVPAWLRQWWVLVFAALLAALVFLWWPSCSPRENPIPPREARSRDSLAITKPPFDSAQLRRAKAETVFVRQRVQAVAGANVAAGSAETFGHVADSLQRLAEQERDTSSLWRATALERGRQVDSLSSSNVQLRVALTKDTMALVEADFSVREERRRRVAIEDLSNRLARDVQIAGRCRILWIASCPTRKAVAVVASLAGAGATYYALKR